MHQVQRYLIWFMVNMVFITLFWRSSSPQFPFPNTTVQFKHKLTLPALQFDSIIAAFKAGTYLFSLNHYSLMPTERAKCVPTHEILVVSHVLYGVWQLIGVLRASGLCQVQHNTPQGDHSQGHHAFWFAMKDLWPAQIIIHTLSFNSTDFITPLRKIIFSPIW